MNEATQQALWSAIRSLLVVIGAGAVTHGYANDETVAMAIGAIMTILPILYGMWQKFDAERKTAAREAVAVNVGVAVSNAEPNLTQPIPAAAVPDIIKAVAPTLPAVEPTGVKP